MIAKLWAAIATVIAAALTVLHFDNPYPLVQVPDRGHRLYAVPAAQHALVVDILKRSGLRPFGTFTAGIRQTLFEDGMTVIASGAGVEKAAISLPVENPQKKAEEMKKVVLAEFGIETQLWTPPDPELKDKLVVLKSANLPLDFAYRLPGNKMPWPKWE
ncbi:MAG: hypothetical protein UY63_C0004G0034 [Parcubacteria group bacterium GW2011_GWA2_51_10]|nr:MAG: hypothetical protein UY63_C0004G0034 [Parcubacteria group bacterium GW2011_GWA2_51_10]